MTARIAIASQKGGAGKTTVALNLAVALAERGRPTLLVDLDPQGAVGLALAREDTEWAGLAEHLMGEAPIDETIVSTRLAGLSLLPRGRLDPGDVCEYEAALHSPGLLESVLAPLDSRFELVILDTMSGLGMVTRAALACADFVLVVFQAESLSLRSISQMLRVIDHVRGGENPRLRLLGILPTMVRLDRATSLDVMSGIWSGFEGVLDTVIPYADVFAKASQEGLPVGFLAGRARPEARRFAMLAAELEDRIAQMGGKVEEEHEQPRRELL